MTCICIAYIKLRENTNLWFFALVLTGLVIIIEPDDRRLLLRDFVCVGHVYGGTLNLFVKLQANKPQYSFKIFHLNDRGICRIWRNAFSNYVTRKNTNLIKIQRKFPVSHLTTFVHGCLRSIECLHVGGHSRGYSDIHHGHSGIAFLQPSLKVNKND